MSQVPRHTRAVRSRRDPSFAPGRLEHDLSGVLRDARRALSPRRQAVAAVHGYLDMVTRLIVERGDPTRSSTSTTTTGVPWNARRSTRRTRAPPARPRGDAGAVRDAPAHPGRRRGCCRPRPRAGRPRTRSARSASTPTEDDRLEIISGDRDLIQLVRDPVVTLLFTVRGVTDLTRFDEAGVLAKYGVPASGYAEFAILRGDPSDGLPGVRGVGEKTARDLILAFGSIDARARRRRGGRPRDQAGDPRQRSWRRGSTWMRCGAWYP